MKATSAKVASRRVRNTDESGVSWKTTLALYWFGKRQRKAGTAKRICAGTSSWGSAVLPGGTSVAARKARLTSAPSFRSQRKTVKSWNKDRSQALKDVNGFRTPGPAGVALSS